MVKDAVSEKRARKYFIIHGNHHLWQHWNKYAEQVVMKKEVLRAIRIGTSRVVSAIMVTPFPHLRIATTIFLVTRKEKKITRSPPSKFFLTTSQRCASEFADHPLFIDNLPFPLEPYICTVTYDHRSVNPKFETTQNVIISCHFIKCRCWNITSATTQRGNMPIVHRRLTTLNTRGFSLKIKKRQGANWVATPSPLSLLLWRISGVYLYCTAVDSWSH